MLRVKKKPILSSLKRFDNVKSIELCTCDSNHFWFSTAISWGVHQETRYRFLYEYYPRRKVASHL